MKVCRRAIDELQIINANGDVRICSWSHGNIIGNIIDSDIPSMMHSERAASVFKPIIDKTYDRCPIENCPYLANKTMDDVLIDIDEIPDYPSSLLLAYEGVCNHMHPIKIR